MSDTVAQDADGLNVMREAGRENDKIVVMFFFFFWCVCGRRSWRRERERCPWWWYAYFFFVVFFFSVDNVIFLELLICRVLTVAFFIPPGRWWSCWWVYIFSYLTPTTNATKLSQRKNGSC